MEEVLSVATGVCVGFGPGVAAGAGPDAFFGRRKTADLSFELIPEGGAFALCYIVVSRGQWRRRRVIGHTILLEGARGCFLAANAS